MTGGRLSGKVAIITGGTSGIGESTVRLFVDEGAKVVVVAQRSEYGLKLIEELGGECVSFVQGDVSLPDTAVRAAETALRDFGQLDILVNNAAMDFVSPILDTSLEDARRVLEVNYLGAFLMLKECAKAMSDTGGAIVNVTSRNASVGVPTMGAYAAAKSALLGLTRTAAIELAEHRIRVNAVAPGITDTPLIRAWINEQEDPDAFERQAASGIPQKRFAAPVDVAQAICFLASDEAQHITGASLPVDGGYTAM